jgi:hypothetical protein
MSQAMIDALRAQATSKINDNQNSATTRDEIRQEMQDLYGLKAAGLHLYERGSEDLQDFAEQIEAHKADLYPWVTVYGAAAGMMGVWTRIMWAWLDSTAGPGDPIDPEVVKLIDTWIPNYVRMIAS